MGKWLFFDLASEKASRSHSFCICCSSILGECEYKYVVRNTDGSIAMGTPGYNFELRLSPEDARGAAVPEKVEVSDAWDASWRKVRVGFYSTPLLSFPTFYPTVDFGNRSSKSPVSHFGGYRVL